MQTGITSMVKSCLKGDSDQVRCDLVQNTTIVTIRIDYTLYNGQQYPISIKEKLLSGFAETDIYLTNSLAAKLGARMEHSSTLEKYNFAPRASLAYNLGGEGQASLAYGIFYQSPEKKYLP